MGEKRYDLEDRTVAFAKRTGAFVARLSRTLTNLEYGKQLVRSSGSIGANYLEANEALGRKDFFMHVRITKKEAKESRYWLTLVECDPNDEEERNELFEEATELMNIFGAIIRNAA